MKKLGCFHAHHSNIEHIEASLRNMDIELLHFVDPGLDARKNDQSFTVSDIQKKIHHTLNWIASTGVDGILITCTFFTAYLNEEKLEISIPIIKIDTPLFHKICEKETPQTLVFTNPETVKGTMNQLDMFADRHQKKVNITPILIEGAFQLVMKGEKEKYRRIVEERLENLLNEERDKPLSVAQLSMAPLAQQVEEKAGICINTPLKLLESHIREALNFPHI